MEVWRGAAEGLNAVMVNPSTILGYGDWHTSSCAIFKSVYDEFPWYTTGINGFVGVEDVARAVVMLMQSDLSGERYIINNVNWTFQQMLNTIADGFGKKDHPGKPLPCWEHWPGAWKKLNLSFPANHPCSQVIAPG
jgi:hypothetical protein